MTRYNGRYHTYLLGFLAGSVSTTVADTLWLPLVVLVITTVGIVAIEERGK